MTQSEMDTLKGLEQRLKDASNPNSAPEPRDRAAVAKQGQDRLAVIQASLDWPMHSPC